MLKLLVLPLDEFLVIGIQFPLRHLPPKLPLRKHKRPVQQIPDVRKQLVVQLLYEDFLGEITILESRLAQKAVSYRVNTISFNQNARVNYIPQGFAHLLPLYGYVAVHEYHFWQLQARRQEHCRPINGVEPEYALSNHMHVCWPVLLKCFFISPESDACHICC